MTPVRAQRLLESASSWLQNKDYPQGGFSMDLIINPLRKRVQLQVHWIASSTWDLAMESSLQDLYSESLHQLDEPVRLCDYGIQAILSQHHIQAWRRRSTVLRAWPPVDPNYKDALTQLVAFGAEEDLSWIVGDVSRHHALMLYERFERHPQEAIAIDSLKRHFQALQVVKANPGALLIGHTAHDLPQVLAVCP